MGDHKRGNLAIFGLQLVQHCQDKHGSLAYASLRLPNNILSLKRNWDTLLLNCRHSRRSAREIVQPPFEENARRSRGQRRTLGRMFKAAVTNCSEQLALQLHVVETDGMDADKALSSFRRIARGLIFNLLLVLLELMICHNFGR